MVWMHAIDTGDMKDRLELRLKQAEFNWDNYTTQIMWDETPFCGWNFRDNGITIHREFYDIFRFNKNATNVGERIVAKLPKEFLGIHLRLEHDANFVSYGGMTRWLSRLMLKEFRNITTLFIAVGDVIIEKEFKNLMDTLGYTVISKWDLAADDPQLLKDINYLHFDQLAVIDHLALVKSTHFFGVGFSTLSYATGLVRGNGYIADCNCHLYQPAISNYEEAY